MIPVKTRSLNTSSIGVTAKSIRFPPLIYHRTESLHISIRTARRFARSRWTSLMKTDRTFRLGLTKSPCSMFCRPSNLPDRRMSMKVHRLGSPSAPLMSPAMIP